MGVVMLWVASLRATRYLWDEAASAVIFTSTPGNKDFIASPMEVTELDTLGG